ncbi:MAG: CvpA family protein [Parvularcula sp.]
MTFADGFIISMIALSVLFSWIRGLSRELLTLLAIGAGAGAVFFFGTGVADMFGGGATTAILAMVLLFVLVFVIASVAFEFLLSNLLGRDPLLPDKLAGAVFGLLRGWLIVGLAYLATTYYAPEGKMPPAIENARLKGVAKSAASVLESFGLEKEYAGDESSENSAADQ